MNVIKKADRWLATRLQTIINRQPQAQDKPMIFLGGMSRTGNHLLHSLIDGHSKIKAIPEEDFFLRTNMSSVISQIKLLYSSGNKRVNIFKEQNRNNLWKEVATRKTDARIGPHKVDFPVIDYDKFEQLLKELSFEKGKNPAEFYIKYIKCILKAVSTTEGDTGENHVWDMYFSGNADFLIRAFMNWDERNKAIIPVRNPLQRLASDKKRDKLQFICTPDIVSSWADVHRSYSRFMDLYKGRILLVDYTQLVEDVDRVMMDVASFLDIEYEGIMSRPTILGRPISGNSSFSGDTKESKGKIYNDSLYKYKNILSNEEISIINNRLSPVYTDLIVKINEKQKIFHEN